MKNLEDSRRSGSDLVECIDCLLDSIPPERKKGSDND
jgi:hypothetical protein